MASPPLNVPILEGDDDRLGAPVEARREYALRLFHQVVGALGRCIDGGVDFLGEGLWHHTWAASVGPDAWVLRIPHGPPSTAHDARLIKEARLLPWLLEQGIAAVVPQPVALVHTPFGLASVQSQVFGLQLAGNRLISGVADAARTVHALPAPPAMEGLEAYPTRLDHGLERLARCRTVQMDVAQAAADWIEAHLPPATPARLLHGDLMLQNLREGFQGECVLLDWTEAMAGDPAFDFCIVTRGVRRPLGQPDTRRRLIDLYHAAGGDPGVTVDHIYLQELALTAEWLAVPSTPHNHDEALARLQRLLKHLRA